MAVYVKFSLNISANQIKVFQVANTLTEPWDIWSIRKLEPEQNILNCFKKLRPGKN